MKRAAEWGETAQTLDTVEESGINGSMDSGGGRMYTQATAGILMIKVSKR